MKAQGATRLRSASTYCPLVGQGATEYLVLLAVVLIVALAISPDTPVSAVAPYLPQIEHVLVMTVYPGFSGQKYLPAMEEKMRALAKMGAVVEVDGGVGMGTAKSAAAAGATLIGAASAIFSKPDAAKAIAELKADAEEGAKTYG